MYKYKVSIVMAVYNVELFLREAIDSIIGQDIGFQNIQLILVDDGSPDGSGAICDEYQIKYPDNIVVIHKENGGVSSARNEGLKHVNGEFINFFDSDDKLSADTVRRVCDFFGEHSNVDLVTIPLHFFDAKKGEHPLNVKFKEGTRVIDLKKEWHFAQLSFASAFVRAECFEGLAFDTNLAYAEDAQLVLKILSRKSTMGVVAEAIYWYRKRSTGTASAVQASGKTPSWYFPYLEHFSYHSIAYARERFGYVPRFVQNTVMYDLQWRFNQEHLPEELFTREKVEAYRQKLFGLLQYIDDEVIIGQKSIAVERKIHLLQAKHPGLKPELIADSDGRMMFAINGSGIYECNHFQFKINFVELYSDRIEIEGMYIIPALTLGTPRVSAVANGKEYQVQDIRYQETVYCVDDVIAARKGFKISVPLEEAENAISFRVCYDDFEFVPANLFFGNNCPVTDHLTRSYYYANGRMLFPVNTGFRVKKGSKASAAKAELLLLKELLFRKDKTAFKAAVSRILVHLARPFAHKNIWLITDKSDRADDNGEAFFLYCMQHKKEIGCHPIFLISKESPDYGRMKQYGPVVPYMTWRHKLLHLLAKHTISAYSHNEITSPFLKYTYYYCNMLRDNKIVFLQHGIIKDDLSKGLNRFHKNFSLFVTSTKAEYESVVSGNYGYSEDQVILTGLPRYDRLYDNNRKKITIMPTWRRSLFGSYNSKTSIWTLRPGFEDSMFFRFYCDLLNSKELIACAEKAGYQLQLLIHPTLFPYLDRFTIDSAVNVLHSDTTYRDVFAESALILTDYSSVAFDMAYLRKPVLYAHFDANHYSEGYFDYERDGFGEVEYDLEGTVNRLIEYMENGCRLKEQYRQRIDQFFMFNDKNNSQRVCEKIMELDSADKGV